MCFAEYLWWATGVLSVIGFVAWATIKIVKLDCELRRTSRMYWSLHTEIAILQGKYKQTKGKTK